MNFRHFIIIIYNEHNLNMEVLFMYKDLCKKVSEKELANIKGGDSTCNWAVYNCIHDTALSAFGTSDPAGKCALMKKVCKK